MESGNGNTWISENFPWLIAVGGMVAIGFRRVLPHLDPRVILLFINRPLTDMLKNHIDSRFSPLEKKVNRICDVIDHMEGAEQAHAEVEAEEKKTKNHWG